MSAKAPLIHTTGILWSELYGHVRFRMLWLLSFAVIVAGILLVMRAGATPDIHIQGELRMLSETQLSRIVRPHLRGKFFTANLQDIRQILMRKPWVQRVEVRRVWPVGVIVHLQEWEPHARWGGEHYLNADGRIFPAASADSGLPQLYGPQGSETQVLEYYENVSPLLEEVGLPLSGLKLETACCWRLHLRCGGEIIADLSGDMEDIRRFVAVYRKLVEQSAEIPMRTDLRYPNGMAIAWHETSPQECQQQSDKQREQE